MNFMKKIAKKLFLTCCFVALLTVTFNGTTFAAQEVGVIISEELVKLNNLYKEGIITQEEFEKAKSILLDPEAAKTVTKRKEKKKKLTALERRQLKEAEAEEKIALKAQLREEKKEAKKNKPKWGQAESQTKYRTLVDLFKRD